MKKIHILFWVTFLFKASSFAQKGVNYVAAGADVSFAAGDFGDYFKPGIGFYTKALFGAGKTGQVTFTGTYSSLKERGSNTDWKGTFSIATLLAGYRHYVEKFFLEPQIGYGVYTYRYADHVEEFASYTDSRATFTWSASAGYAFNKKVEVSARYQGARIENDFYGIFGLKLGYNFALGSSKK